MTTSVGFTLFDTAIGACGIVWGDRGLVGLQLPEGAEAATRSRLRRRFPQALEQTPPATVSTAIEAIVELLRGEAADLSAIELDMRGVPDFHQQVYAIARRIPPGATMTYGDIAKRLGEPGAARAVGQALGRNPFAIVVPCHRVLAANGMGGFSANGGVTTKLRILAIEKAPTSNQLGLFDE